MPLTIRSDAFEYGQSIPREYTGEGEDVSPPLSWTGVPASARQLALICDDPDAPRPDPWVHWVIYNLSADTTGLAEGVACDEAPGRAAEGLNTWGSVGYGGPMPPPGHGVHHYRFHLYALDVPADLPAGLSKEQLLGRLSGHVVGEAELVGVYERR